MKKTALFASISLTILTISLAACDATGGQSSRKSPTANPSATGDTSTAIPIGIALPQTGNVSLIGQESIAGAKIAETYFNQQGGINGIPIKLVFQDTGGDEVGAINAFQTLINQDRVVGIVGPTLSQQAFSSDPIAEREKVPVIGPSNLAKGIPEIGDYIARVSAPASVVTPNGIKVALKLNPQLKKAAVFYAQDQDGAASEAKVFQETIKAEGLEIVTVQKFLSTDTDFQTQATNAINLKPDLITISGLVSDGGNLVKQLRELGYKGLIVGGNGLNTSNIFPVCKVFCDGILIAQAYSPEHPAPINTNFRNIYQKQYQKEPPQFTAQTFTAVQVFVEALKAVNSQTKINTLPLPELRTKLNQQVLVGKYNTPLGEIGFTSEGEVIQKEFYVARIKMENDGSNGKFVFLK